MRRDLASNRKFFVFVCIPVLSIVILVIGIALKTDDTRYQKYERVVVDLKEKCVGDYPTFDEYTSEKELSLLIKDGRFALYVEL